MKYKTLFVVVGFNGEGDCPETQSTVSAAYEDIKDARKTLREYMLEDVDEDAIDNRDEMYADDIMCLTAYNGLRGYYIEEINVIPSKTSKGGLKNV